MWQQLTRYVCWIDLVTSDMRDWSWDVIEFLICGNIKFIYQNRSTWGLTFRAVESESGVGIQRESGYFFNRREKFWELKRSQGKIIWGVRSRKQFFKESGVCKICLADSGSLRHYYRALQPCSQYLYSSCRIKVSLSPDIVIKNA